MGQIRKRGAFLSNCAFWSRSVEIFLHGLNDVSVQELEFLVIDLDTIDHRKIEKLLMRSNLKIYGVSQSKRKKEKYASMIDAVFCKSVAFRKVINFIELPAISNENLNLSEMTLLHLLREGASDNFIAKKQRLPSSTVKYYLRRLYEKLGVENRTQAAMVTIKNNI